MSSYSKNIARLKSTSRANVQFSSQDRLNAARTAGLAQEREAQKIANKLSEFSGHLKKYSKDIIDKRTEEGVLEARRVATENAKERTILEKEAAQIEEAKKLDVVLEGFKDAERMEDGFQDIKAEKLKLEGPSVYPEADRLAKLSPWQQVGYAKEKLRMFNESFPDKLAHELANGTEPININGVIITPAEMRDSNIQGLPFKEVASRIYADKIRKAAGIDRFSPELLKLAGTEKAVQDAIDTQLDQARNRYNIDASTKTRGQADVDFATGSKDGDAISRYHKTIANTVGKDGKIMGNERAWDHVFKAMAKEGIPNGDTTVADKYGSQPLPEKLRKQLGHPPGTTFEKAWPGRFKKLKADILAGFKSTTDAEKGYLQADLTALGNTMVKEHRTKGYIDRKRIDEYRMMSRMLGLKDSRIEDFITIQDEQVDQSKKHIKERMAAQNGFISHEQLNEYHPEAALEFRKKADAFEKALKTEYRVEEKIKAALNRSWEDAGMKQKEKPVVWEYALARALEDYDTKFNDLIAMGYNAKQAAKIALDTPAGGVTNKETGEQVVEFEGVVAEILRSGAGSKYTEEGQEAKDNLAEATLRVHEINIGKQEMLRNPAIFEQEIIGGEYGKERLQAIVQNIKDYGTWKGLSRSQDSLFYYDGLARGKNGLTGHAIIDKQLKLLGHPGLYPARVVEVPDNDGNIAAAEEAAQPLKYEGSADSYNTVYLDLLDQNNYYDAQGESQWNLPFQLPEYLGGKY